MLKSLSAKQKEIALGFIALFFVSGVQAFAHEVRNDRGAGRFNTAMVPSQANMFPEKNSGPGFHGKASAIVSGPDASHDPVGATVPAVTASGNRKPFIGGPSQPEMTAFKSAGTDNMVSPFTGDFSYNIPLMDVGGYPVNMFYNSGIGMDQESSWLGLGWNINPGTITRNMRGLPDDFDGSDLITKKQTFREDKTFGLTGGAGLRFTGFPIGTGLDITAGLSWNNKLGIAAEAGVEPALTLSQKNSDSKTNDMSYSAGLNASFNASSRTGASFSPGVKLSALSANGVNGQTSASIGVGYTYSSRVGLSSMHLDMNVSKPGKMSNGDDYSQTLWNTSGTLSFAYPSVTPSITKPITHSNVSIQLSAGFEGLGFFTDAKLRAYFSKSYIAPEDTVTTHPAYGMLYYEKGNNKPEALLDFNRANDGVYTRTTPTIGMPIYTYDVFSISGEGTGGSFRAYRSDIGHVTDAFVQTKEDAANIGVSLGFGNTIHVGADLSKVFAPTDAGDWKLNNQASEAFSFKPSGGIYGGQFQAAYFKNPGEKSVPDANFQNDMANEDLVRLKLGNLQSATPMLLPTLVRYDQNMNKLVGEKSLTLNNTLKLKRDKRTQSISFLTAEETERIGMNAKIYSYNTDGANDNHVIFSVNCEKDGVDSFYRNHDAEHATNFYPFQPDILGGEDVRFRHKNHISEIDVLGSDGRKYVYGLPVYNKIQKNITFSINLSQKQTDTKALMDEEDASLNNVKGRDWFMEEEDIPAYTHSYLLTELTSPNYVDVTGNGITEDDKGDAVKFNYTKKKDFKWRTPTGPQIASYSEGLKTDEKDDKAHYIYGEREAWYLYSIESKNMVARFYVKNDRKDGRAVNEDGTLDATYGMQRLDKISLYSKSDLTRLGDAAKPIKTVQFFQSYKLTPDVDNNSGECYGLNGQTVSDCNSSANINKNKGKLTLDSVWITYNGNDRKPKSRYVFYYPTDNNPSYSFDQSDRWNNYKPVTDNPTATTALSNAEYPYSIQDKVKADKNAAAWTMNKILLPSGGVIKVDYESDSYAYVQDKPANDMFRILGFGTGTTVADFNSTDKTKLYIGDVDRNVIFFQLPYQINNITNADVIKDFKAKFIGDAKQLYLRLSVQMPVGRGLSGIAGYETIPVYGDYDASGMIDVSGVTVGWVRLGNLTSGGSPMAAGALQFLAQQLPGKAYKSYDLSDENGIKSVILAMGGMLSSAGAMLSGGDTKQMRRDLKCQQAVLDKSFLRLQDPTGNKQGGGLRVKKITMSDNWTKMTANTTNGGLMKAEYGQEYKYETDVLENGTVKHISSGVASWEPSIGGDENPHRQIMRYLNHNKGGPYDYGSVELPLGESFYPSPSVGYSRVEVLSIHRGDSVKNSPVRQVTEFFTTKDFPYRSSATALDNESNRENEPSKILQLLRIDMMKSVTQSQGFLIETNDMNGKEKSHASYTKDDIRPFSYTENFYNIRKVTDKTYGFNHDFPVIAAADGVVTNAVIGRDVEVMADFRQHHSETITANLSINFDGFIVGFLPIPISNLLQPVVREGLMYRSAGLLKVVTHYGVLDSVVVIDKGSMVSTKNLLYDAETGNPLLTRTQNEHNAPIYNFSYPAHWAYSGMGPAYKNIDAVYKGLNFAHGVLTNPPPGIFDVLESGDEIYVVSNNTLNLFASLPCDADAGTNTPWTTLARSTANRIWAVNTVKSGDGSNQWVFMDADGNPFNALNLFGAGADIRIVRSGKRNLLDQSIGAITSLSDPRVTTVVGMVSTTRLVFNNNTNVIQSSTATFKDNWRVDNSFFRVVETHQDSVSATVHRMDFNPQDFLNIRWWHEWRRDGQTNYQHDNAKEIYADNAMLLFKNVNEYKQHGNWYKWEDRRNSFLLYNYNSLPPGALLYKAMLNLYSHSNYPAFPNPPYTSSNHPGFHAAGVPQNSRLRLGEVVALNKNWYYTQIPQAPSPDPWIDNYMRNMYVSAGKGIIPYASGNSWDNYLFGNPDSRVNVTLPIMTNAGQPLANIRQVGLKLNLDVDHGDLASGTMFYRCFWSPNATSTCPNLTRMAVDSSASGTALASSCNIGMPKLSYYYYNWGDVSTATAYPDDPSVNIVLKRYVQTITAAYCRSKFTERKAMNPYVEGVLGNWRVDSTYAYYGERKEGQEDNFSAQVDTRTGGGIKDFNTFWTFAATPPNPATPIYVTRNQSADATAVWVWNSAITQYNRKGYEIENTDPLGRFNSGLYGYDQQLPIAVANNARVREIMYDGFEDYDYSTNGACTNCPARRYIKYLDAVAPQVDGTQKHSGNYSLRVDEGNKIQFQAPVISLENQPGYGIHIIANTTSETTTGLGNGGTNGTGLKASYYNHSFVGTPHDPLVPGASGTSAIVFINGAKDIKINQNSSGLSPVTNVQPTYFSVKFEGEIQVPVTGVYKFKTVSDNGCEVIVNGTTVSSPQAWQSQLHMVNGWGDGNEEGYRTVTLTGGQHYPVTVSYYNLIGGYQFELLWNVPGSFSYTPIPVTYLYPPGTTAFQSTIGTSVVCSKLDSVQVVGNALTDTLSLIPDRQMLLSAWVKVGTANCCFPPTYASDVPASRTNSITIGYNGGSTAATFQPSGNIIEGWQRYESTFTIPHTATSIVVALINNSSASKVFFDDVRVHPFNANMKSFAYHSGNMRLMAELDENNYASFYEYDDDGTLTRVKKETQRGIKTITETRSATQKRMINED